MSHPDETQARCPHYWNDPAEKCVRFIGHADGHCFPQDLHGSVARNHAIVERVTARVRTYIALAKEAQRALGFVHSGSPYQKQAEDALKDIVDLLEDPPAEQPPRSETPAVAKCGVTYASDGRGFLVSKEQGSYFISKCERDKGHEGNHRIDPDQPAAQPKPSPDFLTADEFDKVMWDVHHGDINFSNTFKKLAAEVLDIRSKSKPFPDRSAATVYDAIRAERDRQDRIWGGPSHDDAHDWWNWADYIQERIDKLKGRSEPTSERQQELYLHIAALAVAALEFYNRSDKTDFLSLLFTPW